MISYMSVRLRTFCSSIISKRTFRRFNENNSTPQPVRIRTLNTTSYLSQCWKCGSVSQDSGLFCKDCKSIKKPDTKSNYFDLLGVKHKYEIDDKELTTRFRKLQNVLHPDRFSTKSKEEHDISEEYSAFVNKAYSTLLHPMRRGLYMLQLQGLHFEENDMQTDPQFLALIMEINEQLAEAESSEDIQKLDSNNKAVLAKLINELAGAFNTGDIEAAKQVLMKMKYYSSIDTRIKELKQKLDID